MPRDGTSTRLRLLDAAERLVEGRGFAATSIEQILEASGSSKGAFFHHFDSKRALAHALMVRYVDADLALLRAGLAVTEQTAHPVDKLLSFLGFYENWSGDLTTESACLYLAVASERDGLDPATAAQVQRALLGWRAPVAQLFRDAYCAAGVSDAPDPEDLADQLFVTFAGAYLVCRAVGSPDPMRAQLRVFRQLVQSLLRPTPGTPAPMTCPEHG